MQRSRSRRWIVLVGCAGLALGACGDDEDAVSSSESGPVETQPAPSQTPEPEPAATAGDDQVTTSSAETTTPPETEPPETEPPETEPDGTDPDGPPAPPPTIEVFDAGAEPRRELRFQLTEGDRSTMLMTMTLGLEIEADGDSLPIPDLPPITLTMDVVVDEVTPHGNFVYTFTVEDAAIEAEGADPDTVEELESSIDDIVGLAGTAEITPRGETVRADVDTSAIEDSEIATQLQPLVEQVGNIVAPLPEEAVGVGARWEATSQTNMLGITTEATTRYEVTALTDDSVTLVISQDQQAEPGRIDMPGLPPGADVTVDSVDIVMTGTSTLALSSIVPTAQSEVVGDLRFSIEGEDEVGSIDQHIELAFEIRPG